MARRVIDLPEPDSPTTPKRSPARDREGHVVDEDGVVAARRRMPMRRSRDVQQRRPRTRAEATGTVISASRG